MIPIAIPNLSGNEEANLVECIRTGFVSSVGQFVGRFENKVAELAQAQRGAAVCSGTCGLQLALQAVGVKSGDLVIFPSYTFIATANAVHALGATPWLFDIDQKTWTLDFHQVSNALKTLCIKEKDGIYHSQTRQRIAAIVPVFTNGHPADMENFRRIATQYQIPLIADAAPALGAKVNHIPATKWADLAVFSFNGNKTFTSGGGGVVVGDRNEWIDQVRHLSSTGRIGTAYDHDVAAFNYRMTNLAAAVGCAQLDRYEEFLNKKRQIFEVYQKSFSSLSGVISFKEEQGFTSAHWLSGFVLDRNQGELDRMRNQLKEEGIESRAFWKPIHFQKPYENALKESMQVTENLWNKVQVLPCSTGLDLVEVENVAQKVKKILCS